MSEVRNDTGRPTRSLWAVPEVSIIVFSFAFHFVWEFLQVPTYSGMSQIDHWSGVKTCTEATVGDVGFALLAFWITAAAARSRQWLIASRPWHVMLFLLVGIALTIGFEYYYVSVSGRWTYSALMPLVPPFGTGLSPLIQWILVPLLVCQVSRRILISYSPGSH